MQFLKLGAIQSLGCFENTKKRGHYIYSCRLISTCCPEEGFDLVTSHYMSCQISQIQIYPLVWSWISMHILYILRYCVDNFGIASNHIISKLQSLDVFNKNFFKKLTPLSYHLYGMQLLLSPDCHQNKKPQSLVFHHWKVKWCLWNHATPPHDL